MEKLPNTQMQENRDHYGRRLRLVLLPLPLQGHLNPMLQLASILHSKGFSITVIHTNFNAPNPSNYPHFTFLPISDGLSDGEATTIDTKDAISFFSLLNLNCIAPFRDCLSQLLSQEDESVACLITDAMFHFSQAVADSFNLPRMVLRTSSIASFRAFAALPLLQEKGYLPVKECELEAPIPELQPLRVKDIPALDTSNQDSMYKLIAGMVKATKASSGLIWNSYEALEQSALAKLNQECSIPSFPIGPFHKYFPATSSSLVTQDQSCISWLDTQAPNSVLYVSFGSVVAMHESEFLDIALALANSQQPFLWVVRPGLVRGYHWLEPLPSGFLEMMGGRACIVKWAPQQRVLAHPATGGFWTHNGWNSTLESICEGVPMICLPCFGDQMGNARYVTHVWKVGLRLENGVKRGEIEEAITRLMVEDEGMEMRERIMNLKERANLCLKPGGTSYQSLESLISFILALDRRAPKETEVHK